MKIRHGFVSNSSSSSFLIYGVMIEECTEEMEEWCDKNHYTYARPYDEEVYIGKSWDSIGDDETGKQFKEKVEVALRKLGLDDFGTHEEAWRDG